MKRLLLAIALLLLTVTSSMAAFTKHLVWEGQSTELLWSNQEAYLFVSRERSGWSGSALQYGWEAMRNLVGLSTNATDRRHWLEVTKIDDSSADLTIVPNTETMPLGVFKNEIYATYEGSLAKWSNKRFVPVTAEESKTFFRRSEAWGPVSNPDGWSSQMNLVNRSVPKSDFRLIINGVPVVLTATEGEDRQTIAIQFPNRPPQLILDVSEQSKSVSETTYRDFLAGSKAK